MDDGDLNCSPHALANAEPVREVSRRDFLSLVLDSSSDLSGKPVDHNLSKSFQVGEASCGVIFRHGSRAIRRVTRHRQRTRVLPVASPCSVRTRTTSYPARITVPRFAIFGKQAVLRGYSVGSRKAYERMIATFSEHRVHPVIDTAYPFHKIIVAYRHPSVLGHRVSQAVNAHPKPSAASPLR